MKLLWFALAAFGLAMAAPVLADGDPSWSAPHEPYRIAGNVWYVGTEGIGVYLITTGEGHILIDGATEEGADAVAASITALGYDPKDIRYIVGTHAHYDHAGGLARLKALSGAEVVSSEGDRAALENGRHEGDNIYGAATFPPVGVDRVITDGETLTLGGATLTAHLTPGHTRGATSWSTTVVDNGRPLRVLFFASTTVAGNVLVGNRTYPDIVRDYRISFDRLAALPVDVFLANHPSFANLDAKYQAQTAITDPHGKAKPFIDPQEFPAFLVKSRAEFEAELKRQQAAQ